MGLLNVGIIGYGVYCAFFDMERLPTGEYLTEETFPDDYTLKAYVTNGGCYEPALNNKDQEYNKKALIYQTFKS